MNDAAAAWPPKKYSVKRSRIIAAGTQVLNHQGTRGFTLAAVAKLMEMHPVSLTYYFKTREDLFAACLTMTIDRFNAMVAKARDAAGTPNERVAAFIAEYFVVRREIALGREPMLVSFSELKRIYQPTQSAVRAFGGLLRDIQALFGDDAERLRRASRSRLLIEHLSWTRGWIDLYAVEDYPRLAARLTDIVLHGINAPDQMWPAGPIQLLGEGEGVSQRDRFFIAATGLINRYGYDGASVEQISSSLNVTKGSFYHHHSQKEDVLVACFERTFGIIQNAQANASGRNGWERICSATRSLVAYQQAADGEGLLRSAAIASLSTDVRAVTIGKYRDVAARFAGLVAEGIADGSIRPVDPQVTAQVLIGVVNSAGMFGNWVKGGDQVDMVEVLARPGLMGVAAQA